MTNSIDRRLARLEGRRPPKDAAPKMKIRAQNIAALRKPRLKLPVGKLPKSIKGSIAPTWQAERVEGLLDGRSLVMRFRVSRECGCIEIYYRGELPRVTEEVTEFGWTRAADTLVLPVGVGGLVYRHASVTAECYRRTRDLLDSYTEKTTPTITLPTLANRRVVETKVEPENDLGGNEPPESPLQRVEPAADDTVEVLSPSECRERRKRLEWSQVDLARRANVGTSTVRNFENNYSSRPVRNNISAICAALKAGLSNAPANELAYQRPLHSMLALPAPPKMLALPPPDWMRAVPVKLTWMRPDIYEIGRIKPAPRTLPRAMLRLRADAEDIILRQPKSYWGVMIGDRMYAFYWPLTFSAAHYYVEADDRRVRIGEIDGQFADEALAYADMEEAALCAGVYSDGHRVVSIAQLGG